MNLFLRRKEQLAVSLQFIGLLVFIANWVVKKGVLYLMGNKLGRRREVVDEKYTRPQRLYQHRDIDIKKLKKLILESKLAPCYPGDDDSSSDLEDCPICFLAYPSLNRSRCCMKSICTECFLQLKMPNATRPTQCPFCKTTNYAVEYRGTKSKKEKNIEQIEEQRVIEAKIRMRQQELLEEEERSQRRQETSTPNRRIPSSEGNYRVERDFNTETIMNPTESLPMRDGDFSVDLEDIMVMEAIWLSIQEKSMHRYPLSSDGMTSEQQFMQDVSNISPAIPNSSAAGGLASAIATLVEHQQTSRECSTSYDRNALAVNMLPSERVIYDRPSPHVQCYPEFIEPGQRVFTSSVVQEASGDCRTIPGHVLPESFEEQMMLAMTVSLAEARAMSHTPGHAPWH